MSATCLLSKSTFGSRYCIRYLFHQKAKTHAICPLIFAAFPKLQPVPWLLAVALLILCGFTAAQAAEYYVAPVGTPAGNGSISNPWDLKTALNHPSSVKAGDTIWLRGGTYGSGFSTTFTSRLAGTQFQPIVVRQYPGERATVDGGIVANGAWTTFWGFEITNSSTARAFTSSVATGNAGRSPGLQMYGRGNKAINLVVHDVGHPGIGFWNGVGDGGEVYGCILWGNGIYHDGVNASGSGIYAQNRDGTRYIREVITFRNFTTGFKAYATNTYANGFYLEGNVNFDNGDWDLFGASRRNPMERLRVLNNFTYRRREDSRHSVQFGYESDDDPNGEAVFQNNYFVGGRPIEAGRGILTLGLWSELSVSGNTIIGESNLVKWFPHTTAQSLLWKSNNYYGGSSTPFIFNYIYHPGEDDTLGPGKNTRLKNASYNFAGWKSGTGFDTDSTYTSYYPRGTKIVVRPNRYESGRAHIIVYNWNLDRTVSVDIAGVLRVGAAYEVRDAQNYFGPTVVSGTYDGKLLILPMNLTQVVPLIGNVTHIQNRHTAPEFAVFVLLGLTATSTPIRHEHQRPRRYQQTKE